MYILYVGAYSRKSDNNDKHCQMFLKLSPPKKDKKYLMKLHESQQKNNTKILHCSDTLIEKQKNTFSVTNKKIMYLFLFVSPGQKMLIFPITKNIIPHQWKPSGIVFDMGSTSEPPISSL